MNRVSEEVRRKRWSWIGHGRTIKMIVLWPLDGHQKGKGKEAAQKQLGEEWRRWRETVLAGEHGTWHAVQPQISNNGRRIFEPCVPPGTEKIKKE